jgi:hypothetical protein
MMGKAIQTSIFLVIGVILLVACGNGGPEPGFDVTGLWTEQDGGSTIRFTEAGGYILSFDPSLSDGTTSFEGDSYKRVDNSHLTFTMLMGRASLEIIEVEATINSSNVLRFKLDGKDYRFVKADS